MTGAATPGSTTRRRGPDHPLLAALVVLAGAVATVAAVWSASATSTLQLTAGAVALGALVAHQVLSARGGRELVDRLQRSEAHLHSVVRAAVDPVIILDQHLVITWSSPSFSELMGWTAAELLGRDIRAAVHPDDRTPLTEGLVTPQVGDDRDARTATVRVRRADGSWRLAQARIRDLRDDPDVGSLVLYCRDVTGDVSRGGPAEPVTTPAALPTGADDPATGLPDRSALVARIAELTRTGRSAGLVTLWVAGLADAHRGTIAPPEVLTELAGRFSRVLRTEDWLARSGPQEFTVVLEGSISDAETLAHRLTATVPADVPLGGLRLSASAGVTAVEGADREPVEVLRRAALAMASARTAGPGRVRRHSVALLIAQNRQDALREDLALALERDELRLVYQPVVDVAMQRIATVEALLRWQHPTWGAVSPGEFIPLAEESSLVNTLGRWVMHTATRSIAELGDPGLSVAVNVAARHVRSGRLLTDVLDALTASRLPADRLVLELTESVLLDDAHVGDELAALRRLGVRIAVDDFGTGWSSLAYLVGLPIDILKMDRQFLAHVESDPQVQALCRSVLHLGTSLGLDVVVEGVETTGELRLLRDMGHRFVQGFLLARPTELAELPARLTGSAVTSAVLTPADEVVR